MSDISIVMAYHNRRVQLLNTLKTIKHSIHMPEVVIVDDASNDENRIDDLNGGNIKVIRIDPEEKKWANSCIPFNIGFKNASGDIVIIQNAECLHVGDVIDYAFRNVQEKRYIAFSCYSINDIKTTLINGIDLNDDRYREAVEGIIYPVINLHPVSDCQNGWYCHSQHNPCAHHFCSAITRNDLNKMAGFDERYADGLAYEDMEFIRRIRQRGMEVQIVDDPYVIHQAHKPTDYDGKIDLYMKNRDLYSMG